MPCSAIATARAQVTQENLARLLTDELVKQIARDYLQRKYSSLNPLDAYTRDGVGFIMDGYRVYIKNGTVTVTVGRSGDSAKCAAIANDMTEFLTKAAGLIFQRQIRHAVATQYGILDAQYAPNGALVLSVEL